MLSKKIKKKASPMFPALATAAAAVTRHGAVQCARSAGSAGQAGKHWSGSTGRGGTAAPHAEIKRGGSAC